MTGRTPDALRPLLARQCGVVSRAQALAHGLTDDMIRAQLDAGRWQRAHRGVVAAFTGRPTWEARCWAALLYAGEGATLSHETAAALAGIATRQPLIHVTVPGTRRVAGTRGVRIHSSARVESARHPLLEPPRTRPVETALDLVDEAATVEAALSVVARACQRGVVTPAQTAVAIRARPRLRWRRQMQRVLDDVAVGAHSTLESTYLHSVERAHGLPRAVRQRRVGPSPQLAAHFTDVAYEEFGVLVELDGRLGHREPDGRLRDMRRDNAAALRGERTLRFGWHDVCGRPCDAALQVVVLLQLGAWTGVPRPCGGACPVSAEVAKSFRG